MAHWLIKSEPDKYPFAQLVKDRKTRWDGIRNYTARNNLRAMKKGDLLAFYHSGDAREVVGLAKVVREAYPEPGADGDFSAVDVAPVKAFASPVSLAQIRESPKLAGMVMLKQGRLSVSPLTSAEFAALLSLGKTKV